MSPNPERVTGFTRGLLVAHIWIVAAVIPLLDRLLTLERMLRLLTPRRPFGLYAGVTPSVIAEIVHRRLRRPIHMRRRACLRLSLVLYHFLGLSGSEAVLHIAVFPPSTDPKRLHAHGWVTVGEKCFCEPPKGHAAEILTYASGAGRGASEGRAPSP